MLTFASGNSAFQIGLEYRTESGGNFCTFKCFLKQTNGKHEKNRFTRGNGCRMGSGCIGPAPNGYRGGDQLGGRQHAPAALGSPEGLYAGVVTDLDGHYRITVPGPEAVLQFVYMGMETQEITVGDRTEINVVMQPVDKAIDQVVVVGYGSGKKISSTVGKVSSVGAQKLEAKPAANAMDALAGQVPGLSILSDSGEPSALSSITLHGSGSLGASSDPLYVLDGIPVAQSTILAMNPSDFERIDIFN